LTGEGNQFGVLLRLASPAGFPSRFQFGDALDGHLPVRWIPVIHVIRVKFIGLASGVFKRTRFNQNFASTVLNKCQCCGESFHGLKNAPVTVSNGGSRLNLLHLHRIFPCPVHREPLFQGLLHLPFRERIAHGLEDFGLRHRPTIRGDDFADFFLGSRFQRSRTPRRVKAANFSFHLEQLTPEFGVTVFERLSQPNPLLLKFRNFGIDVGQSRLCAFVSVASFFAVIFHSRVFVFWCRFVRQLDWTREPQNWQATGKIFLRPCFTLAVFLPFLVRAVAESGAHKPSKPMLRPGDPATPPRILRQRLFRVHE